MTDWLRSQEDGQTIREVVENDTEANALIRLIGAIDRQLAELRARQLERIAAAADGQLDVTIPLVEERERAFRALQVYCEAHRDRLTRGGKGKTFRWPAGEVCWRQAPPSLRIADPAELVCQLLRRGLGRFVRLREEPDRRAMLREPEELASVPGVEVVAGAESFIVTPFPEDRE